MKAASSTKRQRPVRLLRSFFPTDWAMKRRFRLPTAELDQPYYIYYPSGLEPDRPWPEVSFDAAGVVTTAEGYNPVTIAQYALYSYERLLRSVPGSKEAFFSQVRYLRDIQRVDGAYPYRTGYPEYGVQPGFLSAMAQGTAASALIRAFAIGGDSSYREAAAGALEPLKADVRQGGVSFIRDGEVFFEEVASDQPCHILNGHLFAAFGIWDVARFGLADDELLSLHAGAVETLLRWLPYYDAAGWSYYQLAVRDENVRHLAHISYHQLHVAQLYVYAGMTGREEFATTALRWSGALGRFPVRARVWFDSTAWLLETTRARAGLARRGPWRPMSLPSPRGAVR